MRYRDTRRPTDFPAVIFVDGNRCDIEIREVSRTGLRISGLPEGAFENAARGDTLTLGILNLRVVCRLRWRRNGMAGLELSAPLPKSVADKVRRKTGHHAIAGRYHG